MTTNERRTPDIAALVELDFETDALFDVLSEPRRQVILAHLQAHDGPVSPRDLAWELAVRTSDAGGSESPAEPVESTLLHLVHVDLPKLADAGIVDYRPEENEVALATDADELAGHFTDVTAEA